MEFRKDNMSEYCKNCYELQEQFDQLKAENEKMSKGYAELTEIVSPYIDDFTGYNQKLGGFDIVLCVKELLQQFKHLKTENDETWKTMSITFDNGFVKTEVADISMAEYSQLKLENTKYKQTLTEIKEIAEPYKMIIKKICGNCKKYDDCNACCYKDINCYKYTSPKTNACEEFTYLDKFVSNILANSILQKISEV